MPVGCHPAARAWDEAGLLAGTAMSTNPVPSASLVQSLAYLYFFVAEHGDEAGLTPPEREHIRLTLTRWLALGQADHSAVHVEEAMNAAWRECRSASDEAALNALYAHVRVVKNALPEVDHRKAVLYDMAAVARADGVIASGERDLVAMIQKLLLS